MRRKKERIGHCVAVTDSVLNQSVQKLPEFAKVRQLTFSTNFVHSIGGISLSVKDFGKRY